MKTVVLTDINKQLQEHSKYLHFLLEYSAGMNEYLDTLKLIMQEANDLDSLAEKHLLEKKLKEHTSFFNNPDEVYASLCEDTHLLKNELDRILGVFIKPEILDIFIEDDSLCVVIKINKLRKIKR